MLATVLRLWNDEAGATAIEYALLGTMIAVALAATFGALGGTVEGLFGYGTGGPADAMASAAENL